MVSTNQSNTSGGEFETEAERFLVTDMALAPLVRGIMDQDRVLEFWNAVNDDSIEVPNRDQRREMIQQRMQYVRD